MVCHQVLICGFQYKSHVYLELSQLYLEDEILQRSAALVLNDLVFGVGCVCMEVWCKIW